MQRDIDLKIVEASQAEIEDDDEEKNPSLQKIAISIKGIEGAKTIQMNTTALENKIDAIRVTNSVASALGVHFVDYLEPIAQLVIQQLVHDKFSSSVRKNSSKLCATLLECCPDPTIKVKLLHLFLQHIALELAQKLEKIDFKSCKWLVKEVQRCISTMAECKHGYLSELESAQLLDLLVSTLTQFQIDKATRLDNFESKKKQLDEEEIDLFKEQLEKADKVWTSVMDICGTLLKTMPEQCSGQVQAKILPLYMKYLIRLDQTKFNETIVLDALCLLCDCLEFGSEELFNAISGHATPKMLEVITKLG